jgi:autotransporter-associated beta strand protein
LHHNRVAKRRDRAVLRAAALTVCAAAAAPTYAVTPLAPYTVQPVVIVPSDRAGNARGIAAQLAAMDAKLAAISHWYSLALGLDARLHVRPATAVYSARPESEFSTVSDNTWFDRARAAADNEYSVGSSSNPHIIPVAVWAGGGAALATNDLTTTGGGFAIVATSGSAGTLAHEIGHTFGLAHPAVKNPVTGTTDNDYTVMFDFPAWPSYPNNPADPSWNLRGLHAWDNNGGGMYQDFFMLARRSDWFRDSGARQMRFDPGGAGNISFGGSGTWQAAGAWSYQSSTTGVGPTTSESHVTWDNAGTAAGADAAIFAGGVASTITVTAAAPVTVSSLQFTTGGYVLAGAPITLTGEAYVAAPETSATIGNVIAGTDGLYKGHGAIVLTGDCTYTGTTTILAGVLTAGFNTATGSLGPGPVVNHGELRFNRADNLTVANDISGTGDLTKLNANTLTLSGALTYEGATTVSAGTLQLASPLASTGVVTVAAGAKLRVLPSAGVLGARQLAINNTGAIDLTTGKLIAFAGDLGTASGGTYTGLSALVQSGRAGGAWNGTGIVTSEPAAQAAQGLTSLGIALAGDVGASSFGGVSVAAGDVLVMYTYAGDADLNGKLDGDDYFRLDANVGSAAPSWSRGDFNYDGRIDGDDYFILDRNLGRQTLGTFARSSGVAASAAMSAVPEPSAFAIGAVALLLAPRRRARARPCHAAMPTTTALPRTASSGPSSSAWAASRSSA